MTTGQTIEWDSTDDVADLLTLADLADSHGLTADAGQLRQAAEDLTVQTGYLNDLERLLERDGNPFLGVEETTSWGVDIVLSFQPSRTYTYHHH